MNVHFIAIGGSVMHQLAIALKRKGYQVTGSDDEIFEPARSNLNSEGILPSKEGWFPEKLHAGLDAVILGMHAKADNPEIEAAKALNLSVFSFPEYLFHESRNKKRIIVGGSHGKTTTTAMIMHVLKELKTDFDYVVGARLAGFAQSVSLTNAPLFICEGDEYPASVLEKRPKFHFLFPHIAILTGISWDHINVFPTFDNYLEQFRIFIKKIEPGGILIYNKEDQVLAKLVSENHRNDISFQPYGIPQHQVVNGETEVVLEGYPARLQVFGDHNLMNLQAAFLVCNQLGITAKDFSTAITSFTGASRRLEKIGGNDHLTIFRDFAHAPSKLSATMSAVKNQFPDRRLVAVFELHTFSSLSHDFLKEYKGSMDPADAAVVYYSNHALQLKRLPELSHDSILEGFANSTISVLNTRSALEQWIRSQDLKNANLLLMSSGDFDGMDMLTFAREIAESF